MREYKDRGTQNSNCKSTRNGKLKLPRNGLFAVQGTKNSPLGTRSVKLKSKVNQERKTKWSRNGGTENPFQDLNNGAVHCAGMECSHYT